MKKLVSIQDISCIGKCSQTIALPIISAMGIETTIIPTAVLSAHTMFPGFTFTDLSSDMGDIIEHWKTLGIKFDAILTGYLGKISHVNMVLDIYEHFSTNDTITIVDPVFGDNGRLYTGFDMDYVNAVTKLCNKATYIVPNITEAAIMANIPYKESYDDAYINEILSVLQESGASNIIITSIRKKDNNGIIAVLEDGTRFEYFKPHINETFHGTGDLFTSTLSGALLSGFSPYDACTLAVDYTQLTLKKTINNKSHNWYGIDFEETIPDLLKMLYKL